MRYRAYQIATMSLPGGNPIEGSQQQTADIRCGPLGNPYQDAQKPHGFGVLHT